MSLKPLTVTQLCFGFAEDRLLKGVDLELRTGEVVTLLGRSGSGKTTLLKLIAGLHASQDGDIKVMGRSGGIPSQNVAYMMQEDLLLPWRTVLDNVLLPTEFSGHSHDYRERAICLLKQMNLTDYIDKRPNILSGGMRQKVALARTLLQNKPLLLLDEPFASLDVSTREELYALLRTLIKGSNTTVLLVTHDFHDALCLSDRIVLLDDGSITQQWTIEDTLRTCEVSKARYSEELRAALKKCALSAALNAEVTHTQ